MSFLLKLSPRIRLTRFSTVNQPKAPARTNSGAGQGDLLTSFKDHKILKRHKTPPVDVCYSKDCLFSIDLVREVKDHTYRVLFPVDPVESFFCGRNSFDELCRVQVSTISISCCDHRPGRTFSHRSPRSQTSQRSFSISSIHFPPVEQRRISSRLSFGW